MPRRERGRGDRSLGRRSAFRDPLPMILVVCEGKVSEPQYCEGFRLARGATTVRVRVEAPGGDPLSLVERAIEIRDEAAARAKRERDENLKIDEVWCVLDVDEHARLTEARTLARREGIDLAVSNPCFELWVLLHFADHTAHLTAGQAARALRKHIPQYDKQLRFEVLEPGYPEAVRRATTLDRYHADLGQDGANPSTGAYRLTERIREFGKEARLK